MSVTAIIASLHWLRPHWLWALPILLLLPAWWRVRRRRRSVWREAVDPHLLPHLLDGGSRRSVAPWLALLAAALAICALAGPSWRQVETPLWQSRAPLVVALDLSSATLAADQPPSRLLQARAKIATLLQRRAGGQVGLVAFADDAHTVAPLTEDTGNVALFLDALSPDVMPVDGSRADRAITWSARLLRQAGFRRGDILLLTDHADIAARVAAKDAAGDGFHVSALGLGSPGGAAYRDVDGGIEHARLDEASLRALATAGGGAYATLSAGERDLLALGVLDPPRAGGTAARGETALLWQDQGYWLLLPLLAIALFAFRRGGVFAAVLLCLLPWQPARATEHWWLRPDQQAHARMEQGAQAYRKQDFATAEQSWRGLPDADAAYNRGNALAQQGRYDDAIAAYDEALRRQPGMADAIANRKAVEAAKNRKPPPGGQGKQGTQQSSSKADRSQRNPTSGQDRDNAQQQRPDAGTPQQRPAPAPSPSQRTQAPQPGKAQDTQAQRQADAAQRRRMQEALRRNEAQQRGAAMQARKQRQETPAERERRLADQAWLRRVPDDPGGLLRARFRLEYERRQQEGTP